MLQVNEFGVFSKTTQCPFNPLYCIKLGTACDPWPGEPTGCYWFLSCTIHFCSNLWHNNFLQDESSPFLSYLRINASDFTEKRLLSFCFFLVCFFVFLTQQLIFQASCSTNDMNSTVYQLLERGPGRSQLDRWARKSQLLGRIQASHLCLTTICLYMQKKSEQWDCSWKLMTKLWYEFM